MGAGILAMPSAYAALGYVPATCMILLAATFAAFGLHLLVNSSQYIGRGATVNKLANLTYPQASILFDVAIALKCFGVAISYLVVIGDVMPSIVLGMGCDNPILISRHFWLLVSAILMMPLTFLKRMDSLKYTSFAGLLSVVYLVGIAFWNFYKPDATRPPLNAGMEAFVDYSPAMPKSFSVFVFSFTCHQNVEHVA
jgi:amino acid permease